MHYYSKSLPITNRIANESIAGNIKIMESLERLNQIDRNIILENAVESL